MANTAFPRQRLPTSRFMANRQLFEKHALPLYGLGFVGAAFVASVSRFGRLDVDQEFVTAVVFSSAIVLAFAYATRWIGFKKIADFIEQMMLLFMVGIVCAFCSVILASTAAPLADPLLRRADLLLFSIDRSRFIVDLHMSAHTLNFWRFAYDSLAYTPAIALALLAVAGQRWRAWALLTALIAGAMVSMTFLLILPAYGVGPYPYEFAAVLDGARDGSIRRLDASIITGIVTFPSMHAADAVILSVGFGWLGKWAMPLVALNVLMFFSALIVGGHYAVDLVAGGVVGLACVAAALWIHRRLEKPSTAYAVTFSPHYMAITGRLEHKSSAFDHR